MFWYIESIWLKWGFEKPLIILKYHKFDLPIKDITVNSPAGVERQRNTCQVK